MAVQMRYGGCSSLNEASLTAILNKPLEKAAHIGRSFWTKFLLQDLLRASDFVLIFFILTTRYGVMITCLKFLAKNSLFSSKS